MVDQLGFHVGDAWNTGRKGDACVSKTNALGRKTDTFGRLEIGEWRGEKGRGDGRTRRSNQIINHRGDKQNRDERDVDFLI